MKNDKTARFKMDFDDILRESESCPSNELLLKHLDHQLPADQAQQVEFHLYDCPTCTGLMHSLEEDAGRHLESDPEYQKQCAKDMDRTAAILGLSSQGLASASDHGFFSWLWNIKLPAFVPAAVAAVFLVLLIPAYLTDSKESVGERTLYLDLESAPTITLDLRQNRSSTPDITIPTGISSKFSILVSSADLTWDHSTPILCSLIEPEGTRHISRAQVQIDGGNWRINQLIHLPVPGTWTVELVQEGKETPFYTGTIEVTEHQPE